MIWAATPSSRSARASAIESPVLPVAVAPAMTSSGGAAAGVGIGRHCLTIATRRPRE
jgi:hypothetical protein